MFRIVKHTKKGSVITGHETCSAKLARKIQLTLTQQNRKYEDDLAIFTVEEVESAKTTALTDAAVSAQNHGY